MAAGRRPTLRDVAQALGLSVTQTSRALNGHADVALSTRERAQAAARELGYIPNLEARRLKMPDARSHSIGLVLVASQRFSDPFLGSLLTTMVDEAAARGYELQLSAPIEDEDPTESYRRAIVTKRVDGFVVLRTAVDDPRVHFLAERSFPFVTFGRTHRTDDEGPFSAVAEDPGCLQPAVDHLVGLGHRRIGCLIEPEGFSIGTGRHRSFLRSMEAAGLTPTEDHIVPSGFRDDTAFDATGRLLERADRPTALITSNDLLALGAMRAAAALGIGVPDQLSIIGFDDISAAQFTTPGLTTLRHHDGAVGRELVTQLLAVIDDPATAAVIELQPELIVRGSTAPPPSP